MRLEVAGRAQREVNRLGRWWLQNREKAPSLFEEELGATYRLILESPTVGQAYTVRRGRQVLRVLMGNTKNHVYYFQLSPDVLRVVSVWSAVRGRGPNL